MRRLSLFFGSFTLDAAEAVCTGDPLETEDILDGVSALVDKSIVAMEPGDGVARYRLLETVRQYGLERLKESGERPAQEERYVGYYLGVIEAAAPNLVGGSNAPTLLAELVAEQDNLRACTCWAVGRDDRAELALRFVGAMYWFWYALGQFREARDLTDRALALDGAAPRRSFRGRALVSSALTALAQGEYPLACRALRGGDPAAARGGRRRWPSVPRWRSTARRGCSAATSRARSRRSRRRSSSRATGRRTTSPSSSPSSGAPGPRTRRATTTPRASCSPRNTEVGAQYNLPTTLAHGLVTEARVELARGNVEAACTQGDGGARARAGDQRRVGDRPRGRRRRARRGAAQVITRRRRSSSPAVAAHRERLAVALPGLAPAERVRLVATLRDALGARYAQLEAEGRALSTAQVVGLALSEAARHTTEHRVPVADPLAAVAGTAGRRLRVLALGPLQVFVDGRARRVDGVGLGAAARAPRLSA